MTYCGFWEDKRSNIRKDNNYKIKYHEFEYNEREIKALPVNMYEEVLSKIPYGDPQRVFHRICFHAGLRLQEVNNLDIRNVVGNTLYWELGKNQSGKWRRAWIPSNLIEEIHHMMRVHGSRGHQIFRRQVKTLRREFNMLWRPLLSEAWNEKISIAPTAKLTSKRWHTFGDQFLYSLKNYRKTWATLQLARYYIQYKDWNYAASLVAADMKHSCVLMTTNHYIACVYEIKALEYAKLHPAKIDHYSGQQVVMAYL